ncbi:MAG: 4-alpha-glucanotransferase [Bacteroidales bacterium]|jgi:4-alpha-glucanotransferase|nr:4-alpha-glucanotransferase [Bacteroidales bacterium]
MKIKFNIHYNTQFGQEILICGSPAKLGANDWKKAAVMQYSDGGRWSLEVSLPATVKEFTYRYAVRYPDGRIAQEWGYERKYNGTPNIFDTWNGGEKTQSFTRSAGIAIPVFSLRTDEAFGTGEFYDLMPLIDWASATGFRMVQTLPVNDTVSDGSWDDSYPYGAISVFALHPIYLRLDKLMTPALRKQYATERDKLNALSYVDYPSVMSLKWKFLQKIYAADKGKTIKTTAFKKWFSENSKWLQPYCAYCYLRDTTGFADFAKWGKYTRYSDKKIAALPVEETSFYAFIQYHLHLQLSEVHEYARKKNVLLKGDIPIGVSHRSCDAWVAPELYNMDAQAGAPPDAFSTTGQNWGFPTYNWEEMGKDGYAWWIYRLRKMAEYFDAFRIDHILGFFRIWEIPLHSVQGLLGHFSPALPLSIDELHQRGAWFDCDRLCKPYVTDYILRDIFGDIAANVQKKYFENHISGRLQFKEKYNTQKKVEAAVAEGEDRDKLLSLLNEVVLLEDPRQAGFFHPRIALHYTRSYNELDDVQRRALDAIYNDFFYRRHNEFWKSSALMKLPAIRYATDMLVCGEDLGMVASSVPQVMNMLHILSLVIQRMPNDSSVEFANLSHTPFESVCSPSSHDMNGIRAWWEEDRAVTERYYYNVMKCDGDVPYFCEDWVAENIIKQHLYSPSMWAVFPLQDLLAMDISLRLDNPQSERINDPANPKNRWKYRMHLKISDLSTSKDFNNKLSEMIKTSNR